ncbi:uncharacterized protein LOC144861116 [Branchiostoma floridae x Branchiostoma japonicum]
MTTPPTTTATLPMVTSRKIDLSNTSMMFDKRTKGPHTDSTRTTGSLSQTKSFASAITVPGNTLQSSNSPTFTQIPITTGTKNTLLKTLSAWQYTKTSLATSSTAAASAPTSEVNSDNLTSTQVLTLDTNNTRLTSQHITVTPTYRQEQQNSSHNLPSTEMPTSTVLQAKPTVSPRTRTENMTVTTTHEDEPATIVVETETDILTNPPTVARPHTNTHFNKHNHTTVLSRESTARFTTESRKSETATTSTIINAEVTTTTQTTSTIKLTDVDAPQTKKGCEVMTFPAPIGTVARRVEEDTPVHMYIAIGGAAGGATLLLAAAMLGWVCWRRTMVKRAHVYTNAGFAKENIIYEDPIYLWPKDIVNTDDVKWTSEDQVTLWPWEATPIYQRQWLPTPSTISEEEEIS